MQFDIVVNNRAILAKKGETILDSLNRSGIRVPTLCNMKGLHPTGACRICVVEVEGSENLVPACSHPVEKGMRVFTHSPRVLKARKTLVELLLSNHPDDCLYCERNGNCELQELTIELNIRERRMPGSKSKQKLDISSPSLVRDPAKCILCGRCVRICDEIQSVSALEFINRGSQTVVGVSMNRTINKSSCINCGQCVLVCPTAALRERSDIEKVLDALNNKALSVAVQFDSAISVSVSQEFGFKVGKDINGLIVAALKKIGFDYVFDSSFAADLMIVEMANELKRRIDSGINLPMISSNCPAWVTFVRKFYPHLTPMLSSCKSPQLIMGALIKSFFAEDQKINPKSIFSVALTSCLARKAEIQQMEMVSKGLSDVDAALSARELVQLIRLYGIDLANITPQQPDSPFNVRSTAGKLLTNAGGTSEALVRTLHPLITGKELTKMKLNDFRSFEGTEEVNFSIGKVDLKVTLSNGLTGINELVVKIELNTNQVHFFEIMACPGGCINGGGQPIGSTDKENKIRAKTIYDSDDSEVLKVSHNNSRITEMYSSYLKEPRSNKVENLLQVNYHKNNQLPKR